VRRGGDVPRVKERNMTVTAEEDLRKELAQHKKELEDMNERALIRSELQKLGLDVKQIKNEIVGDAHEDGIRTKVRRHDELIKRLTWAITAIITSILAGIGKWVWSRLSNGG